MSLEIRVKELCKECNITLADLAQKIGVQPSSLSQIVRGNPTLSKLQDIASALEVDITALFDRSAAETPTGICPYCGKPIKIKLE